MEVTCGRGWAPAGHRCLADLIPQGTHTPELGLHSQLGFPCRPVSPHEGERHTGAGTSLGSFRLSLGSATPASPQRNWVKWGRVPGRQGFRTVAAGRMAMGSGPMLSGPALPGTGQGLGEGTSRGTFGGESTEGEAQGLHGRVEHFLIPAGGVNAGGPVENSWGPQAGWDQSDCANRQEVRAPGAPGRCQGAGSLGFPGSRQGRSRRVAPGPTCLPGHGLPVSGAACKKTVSAGASRLRPRHQSPVGRTAATPC